MSLCEWMRRQANRKTQLRVQITIQLEPTMKPNKPRIRPSLSPIAADRLANLPWSQSDDARDLALISDETAMQIFAIFGKVEKGLRTNGRFSIHIDGMVVDVERLLADSFYKANRPYENANQVARDALALAGMSGELTIPRLEAMAMKLAPAILALFCAESSCDFSPESIVVGIAENMAKDGDIELIGSHDPPLKRSWKLTGRSRERVIQSIRSRWGAAVITHGETP